MSDCRGRKNGTHVRNRKARRESSHVALTVDLGLLVHAASVAYERPGKWDVSRRVVRPVP